MISIYSTVPPHAPGNLVRGHECTTKTGGKIGKNEITTTLYISLYISTYGGRDGNFEIFFVEVRMKPQLDMDYEDRRVHREALFYSLSQLDVWLILAAGGVECSLEEV